jgi:hypothetical protein
VVHQQLLGRGPGVVDARRKQRVGNIVGARVEQIDADLPLKDLDPGQAACLFVCFC